MSVRLSEVPSTAMVLVPLLLSLLLPLVSTQTTYHIKPTAESLCTYGNCLTLSEYAKETSRYLNSTTILQFLPGVHTLNNSVILLQNLDSLVLFGRDSFAPHVSIIECGKDSGIIFVDISKVKVIGLTFQYCGKRYILTKYAHRLSSNALPTLSALRIPHFHLVNCQFEDNYLPLFSYGSNILIQDNRFEWNNRGAVLAISSYILFKGYNVFKNNRNVGTDTVDSVHVTYGGAIYALHSQLVLEGSSHFISNYAHHGGAIAAYNTTIDIMLVSQMNHSGLEGRCEFTRNSATEFGGAIFIQRSFLRHTASRLTFDGNHAGPSPVHILFTPSSPNKDYSRGFGGAIAITESTWHSNSTVLFSFNYAHSGGAVYSSYSQISFENTTTVIPDGLASFQTKETIMVVLSTFCTVSSTLLDPLQYLIILCPLTPSIWWLKEQVVVYMLLKAPSGIVYLVLLDVIMLSVMVVPFL